MSQMGYFRDVTAGQSLEDVDISVHCDIAIFEWLVAWIKHQDKDRFELDSEHGENGDVMPTSSAPPKLEPNNVISILVSAAFLKMAPLVTAALRYIHQNMNRILGVTHNLSCIGDPLLTR